MRRTQGPPKERRVMRVVAWARQWTTHPAGCMEVLGARKQSRSTGIGRRGRSRSGRRRSSGRPSSGQIYILADKSVDCKRLEAEIAHLGQVGISAEDFQRARYIGSYWKVSRIFVLAYLIGEQWYAGKWYIE